MAKAPEQDLTPSLDRPGGGSLVGSPAGQHPKVQPFSPSPSPTASQTPADLAEEEFAGASVWRQHRKDCFQSFLTTLVTYPGVVALSILVIFSTLAGICAARLPPRLLRGLDVLAGSDVDAALVQSAFASAVADNSQTSQRQRGTNTSSYRLFDLLITYELKDAGLQDGILNMRALGEIATFERSLLSKDGWVATCALAEEGDGTLCSPGLSFVNYVLATPNITRGALLPRSLTLDGQGREPLPAGVALHLVQQQGLAGILLPRDFGGSFGRIPTALRSVFRFTLPCSEQCSAQEAIWERFLEGELLPFLRAARADKSKLYQVDYTGTSVQELEYVNVLFMDLGLAAGALVFSFVYLACYTRSILLSVVVVYFISLSLPISHALFVLISGSSQVIGSFLLSMFCSLGIGVDTALAYTDRWWDSAKQRGLETQRLVWTYTLAGRSSFAVAFTTSLSFFAVLASILRPLRQLGLFTGISILVTWLLLSLGLLPCCLFGDRHCSACRLHVVPSGKASTASSPLRDKSQGATAGGQKDRRRRLSYRAFDTLLPPLYSLRCPACLLPVLASVAFCYIALWQAQRESAAPQLLPQGHVASRWKLVDANFEQAADVFGTTKRPPASSEQVCSEENKEPGSLQQRCALSWCEADTAYQPLANGSCTCYRRERTECRLAEEVTTTMQFAGLQPASDADLLAAASAFINLTQAGLPPLGSPAVTSLAPLLMEEWASSKKEFVPRTQVLWNWTRPNTPNASCGWEDLCFCGKAACLLPQRVWSQVQQPFPHVPSLVVPAALLQNPADEKTVVHVIFGVQVLRKMPLLTEEDWRSTWTFMESFDISQPATQREIHSLCSDVPPDLQVSERRCWTDDWRAFLQERNENFPVIASRFHDLFAEFMLSGRKGFGSSDQHFWIHEGKVKACSVSFTVETPRTVGPSEAMQKKLQWDAYLRSFNSVASLNTNGAFHTSDLWVQADVERCLISNASLVAGVVLVLAYVSMLLVSQNFLLPIFVIMSALGSWSGMLFFAVVILRWKIGPMEVVILSAFSGCALQSALHVACAYSSSAACKEVNFQLPSDPFESCYGPRLHRTGHALKSVGGTVLASSIAMAVNCAFLAVGQLALSRKFGAVMPVLLVLSAFSSLLPLPAGFLMSGPTSLQWRLVSRREAQEQWRASWRRARSCLAFFSVQGPSSEGQNPTGVKSHPPSSGAQAGITPGLQEEFEEDEGLADMFVSAQVPVASRGTAGAI